jgi:pilus assembly protein Flp/PilA
MRLMEFLRNDQGATSIEYALIASGVALVIVTAVSYTGTQLNTTIMGIAGAFK